MGVNFERDTEVINDKPNEYVSRVQAQCRHDGGGRIEEDPTQLKKALGRTHEDRDGSLRPPARGTISRSRPAL
jgi:hypothetical protein